MKLFSSYLLAVTADKEKGACSNLLRDKLKEYPIIGGEWKCTRKGKDKREMCNVVCDGNGYIYRFKSPYSQWWITKRDPTGHYPRIRTSGCSVDKPWKFKSRYLDEYDAENPIECLDFDLGQCSLKAQEVKDRQKGNPTFDCDRDERSKEYSCQVVCENRTYLTPERSAYFKFKNCHTENPELSFHGMTDGETFECLSCDEKIDQLSSQIENGSFVKLGSRNRRDDHYPDGGGNGGNGGGKVPGGGVENFSNWYELKCDDDRVEAKYRCYNL